MTIATIEQCHTSGADETAITTEQTTCCIVGGGPAGAVLVLMLARKGIPVTLLEEHKDFDRDFRGDTLHPSVLEIMDELGLAEQLHELPHTKLRGFGAPFNISFSLVKTRYPYIMMVPQSSFLEFLVGEASRYPCFRLEMGARAEELIIEGGEVRGVVYRTQGGHRRLHAALTVGADGRFSRIRRLAGFEPIKSSPPIDIMWFRLPRNPGDTNQLQGRIRRGHILVMLNRFDHWQLGYVIPKGSYQKVREAGMEALRQAIVETAPELADRIGELQDWKQIAVLAVESSRVPRWHRPGLLLIGDAAHTMSPVAGVGINYAIQDAVEAANLLSAPLHEGRLRNADLAAVQRRRELPVRVIQTFQNMVQDRILGPVLHDGGEVSMPLPIQLLQRLPPLRVLLVRLVGFGLWPSHVAK
ncbi:MAG TPA: FAD-dependent oxidoreductase [Roseiflexaceae bacterium]|nr:FAD-dependent oxidoreductase [Roseiflexaceae bacterium]